MLGKRILLCIPNADLLSQWTDLLDRHYTLPYTVADPGRESAFDESGLVIATYVFAANHEAEASAAPWDIAVFEEATAISAAHGLAQTVLGSWPSRRWTPMTWPFACWRQQSSSTAAIRWALFGAVQRMGQRQNVLFVAFASKENFADVRKLELVGKRMLVSGGVGGIYSVHTFTRELAGKIRLSPQYVE